MPDSVLFKYHYLGGYINSELPNHDKAIKHLLEAKTLCETKLGTHTIPYMEIMKGLGDEYTELGEYEKALETYQEAIVKSMVICDYAGQAFGNLITAVADCYERLGWFNEIPKHFVDAWSFWDKDHLPLETYSYYPLWCLEQFYSRYGIYDKAIAVSDKILEFITSKGGDNHPELCQDLYMRGNILRDAGRGLDAINAYEKAIAIFQSNGMIESELLGMILGNLACTYLENNDYNNCNRVCDLMKTYYAKINDTYNYYNNLKALGILASQHKDFEEALSYFEQAEQGNLTPKDIEILNMYRSEILFNQDILSHSADFISAYKSLDYGTDEWFENAYNLSCAYSLLNEIDNNIEVLISMQDASHTHKKEGEGYLLWIYNNLVGICFDSERYEVASTYAQERLDYINSLGPISPEIQPFYMNCLNSLVSAKLRSGKIDSIDSELDILKVFYLDKYGEDSIQYETYLHNRGRAYQLQKKLEEAKDALLKSITIQNRINGKPMERTVKLYLEVEEELGEL